MDSFGLGVLGGGGSHYSQMEALMAQKAGAGRLRGMQDSFYSGYTKESPSDPKKAIKTVEFYDLYGSKTAFESLRSHLRSWVE